MKNNVNYNAELGKALVQDSQGNHLCSHTQGALPNSANANVRIGKALYLPPPKVVKKPRIFARPTEPVAITYDLLFAVLSNGQWQIWLSRAEDAPVQIGAVPIRPQYPTWFVCYVASQGVGSISGTGAVTWDNVASANLSSVASITANSLSQVVGFVQCLGAVNGLASPVVPAGLLPGNVTGTATATLTATSNPFGSSIGLVLGQQPVSTAVGIPVSANFNATVQKVWSNLDNDWQMLLNGIPGGSFEGSNTTITNGVPSLATVAGSLAVTFSSAPVFGILSASKSEAWPWVTTPYCSYYEGQTIIKPPEPLPNQGTDPRTIVTQLCDAILPTEIPRRPQNWRDAVAIHLIAETPPSRHGMWELVNPLLNFDTRGGYLWILPYTWKTDLKTAALNGVLNRYTYDYATNTLGEVRESLNFTIPQINPADYGVEAEAVEILGIAAYTK